MTAPHKWHWVAWSASLVTTSVASFTLGLFVGAFTKPHAFGNRDGQGAAGLAALALLGAAAFVLVSGGALLWSSRRVVIARRWVWPIALGFPLVALLVGGVLSRA